MEVDGDGVIDGWDPKLPGIAVTHSDGWDSRMAVGWRSDGGWMRGWMARHAVGRGGGGRAARAARADGV